MACDKKYKFFVIFVVFLFGYNEMVWCMPEPAAASDEVSISLSIMSNNGDGGNIQASSLENVNVEINTYIEAVESDAEIEAQKLQLSDLPDTCSESNENGIHVLSNGEKAFCENKWTVFQRRLDGSVSFDRPWQDYKFGFGNMSGEFWWGLEKLHEMTQSRTCRLRVELRDFNDGFAFAEYSFFFIDSESTNYVLHVGGYSGTAGDSLQHPEEIHDNQPFTTKDRDNDQWESGNCAIHSLDRTGGWWYYSCFRASLNQPWGTSVGTWTNIVWYTWKGSDEALKATKMMLRCD